VVDGKVINRELVWRMLNETVLKALAFYFVLHFSSLADSDHVVCLFVFYYIYVRCPQLLQANAGISSNTLRQLHVY
jgi:hypothetical protein